MSLRRRILRLRRDERGMALVLALAIMLIFGTATVSVIAYTMSNSTAASNSSATQVAYNLADAGLTKALAIVANPANASNLSNPALLPTTPTTGLPSTWADPASTALTPATKWTLPEGTARAWGTLTPDSFAGLTMGGTWTITATGTTSYAAGGQMHTVTRKVSADLPIVPSTQQPLTSNAWHYIFSWNTGSQCDETVYNNTTVRTSMYVMGNLCMQTPSSIEGPSAGGAPVGLVVRGYLNFVSNTDVGTGTALSTAPVIGGGCYTSFAGWKALCSVASGFPVAPGSTNVLPPPITPPVANFPGWYHYSKPGPLNPCNPTLSSAPSTWPTFDNDTTLNNSLPTVVDLTPTTGYSCVVDSTHMISWTPSTKKLVVQGTIYVDGSVTSSASKVDFDGSGALYMSGTFLLKNSTFCVILQGNNCDGATWGAQASPDLLVIVADGAGTGGSDAMSQVATGDGVEMKSSNFQGAIYGTHTIEVDTTSNVQAPMVSGTEIISQHGGSPFPQLVNVPFGIPGDLIVNFTAGQEQLYRDG
jgi:Tfp pilus assembly protein PilX